jgi:gas vesicle protein
MFGFLIGVAVGSLVGSMIALLIAPDSGEGLRTSLRARGQGFLDQVRSASESRRFELQNRLESLRAPREG